MVHTILLSLDGDDSGIGTSLHCEGKNGAVVSVERVQRTHDYLSRAIIGGQPL